MHRARIRKTIGRVTALALATALALIGGWSGISGTTTKAAFPGKNGKIAFDSDRVTADSPEGDSEIYTHEPGRHAASTS